MWNVYHITLHIMNINAFLPVSVNVVIIWFLNFMFLVTNTKSGLIVSMLGWKH